MKCPIVYPVESTGTATRVYPCSQSPTGYVVRFCLKAPQRRRVWVIGDWMFSHAAGSTVADSARIWPHQWRRGLFPHTLLGLKSTPKELKNQTPGEKIDVSKFEFDWKILKLGMYEMERGEDGLFTCTIPLPSGVYNYRFVLDLPDGNPLRMETITDPAAPPSAAPGESPNMSQVFVPFDPAFQEEDRGVELPAPAQWQGSVEYRSYPTDPRFGLGDSLTCAVYLPRGYDAVTDTVYSVLYLSHGGGDSLSAWLNQGAMTSILDQLIGEGKIPPVVVVLMDNEAFHWNNAEKTIPNLTRWLMPWVEENYRVSREPTGRGFAGLSAGGMLAFEVLDAVGGQFGAVGIWSGGRRFPADPARPLRPQARVHIGAGYYDDAHYAFALPLEKELTEQKIPYLSWYPLGGHQWQVWRKLLEDYLIRVFPGPGRH